MTTTEELNHLKGMIETSYRPNMNRIMIWCELLYLLCFISIAISVFLFVIFLFVIFLSSPQLLMVPIVCIVGSLILFIWIRKTKDKASKIMSLIDKIEGVDDPVELDSIDLDDYGLGWVVGE